MPRRSRVVAEIDESDSEDELYIQYVLDNSDVGPSPQQLAAMHEALFTPSGRFDSTIDTPSEATDAVTRVWVDGPCIYGDVTPAPFLGLATIDFLRARARAKGETHVDHPLTMEKIHVKTEPRRVVDIVQTVYEAKKETADTKLERDEATRQRDEAIREFEEVKRERDEARKALEKAISENNEARKQLDEARGQLYEERGQHNEALKRIIELESQQRKRALPFEKRSLSRQKLPRKTPVNNNSHKKAAVGASYYSHVDRLRAVYLLTKLLLCIPVCKYRYHYNVLGGGTKRRRLVYSQVAKEVSNDSSFLSDDGRNDDDDGSAIMAVSTMTSSRDAPTIALKSNEGRTDSAISSDPDSSVFRNAEASTRGGEDGSDESDDDEDGSVSTT